MPRASVILFYAYAIKATCTQGLTKKFNIFKNNYQKPAQPGFTRMCSPNISFPSPSHISSTLVQRNSAELKDGRYGIGHLGCAVSPWQITSRCSLHSPDDTTKLRLCPKVPVYPRRLLCLPSGSTGNGDACPWTDSFCQIKKIFPHFSF